MRTRLILSVGIGMGIIGNFGSGMSAETIVEGDY
jgi:hypothetical protein